MIRLARAHRLVFGLLLLLSSASRSQAQQNPRLTPVNYGNIVLTASNWPFLIAEQEGLFQKEGIDFKRVIGGNTTATTQTLVAGSTDFAQMNLVNVLGANSAGADLIVIAVPASFNCSMASGRGSSDAVRMAAPAATLSNTATLMICLPSRERDR